MNNYPTPAPSAGYYIPSATTTTDIELKCKFCGSLLLPIGHQHSSSASDWLCVKCPNLVAYDFSLETHQILCQHNNCWYDIIYLPHSKQYIIYQIKTALVVQAEQATESYTTVRTLVKQLESEQNITPTNAKDKLLTILTFS